MSRSTSHAWLCGACQEIFSSPRKLAYGSIHPWVQTAQSFQEALRAGCHLCHLIEESRNYNLRTDISHSDNSFPWNTHLIEESQSNNLRTDISHSDDSFPKNTNYSFKALNPRWAHSGTGPKWYAYQGTIDPWTDPNKFLRAFERDPTPNNLGTLLATDAENLVEEAQNSWLVLEFYGHEHIVLPMELCAVNDTLGELVQTKLDSQTSTGQPETLQLARAWLQNCLDSHTCCGSRQPEDWLPTRLLDVGSFEAPCLRLVSGASLDAKPPYVALSHRWGSSKRFLLKSSNLAAYQMAIPSTDISDTVRDAVAVTRALGIRYIWIDCMCIIQDDGGQDWIHEAETMSKVYGLSTCTIAAANSGDGEGGFFAQRNPYHIRPCRVPNPFNTNSKYSFNVMSQYLNRIYEEGVRRSEWFKRGWVFQERILAPRLLIFSGKQVLWGCNKLQAAETWPGGKTSENHIDQFTSVEVEKARLSEVLDEHKGISKSHAAWWTLLQDYMSSELTHRSDRLAAIKGIAALVGEQTGETYCGGFWLTDDLPNALLWRVKESPGARPAEYRAPSFSWAAVEGEVLFNTANASESATSLIHIKGGVQLPGSSFGGDMRIIREALQMSGALFPASFVTSASGVGIVRAMTRGAGLKRVRVDIISKITGGFERRQEMERIRRKQAEIWERSKTEAKTKSVQVFFFTWLGFVMASINIAAEWLLGSAECIVKSMWKNYRIYLPIVVLPVLLVLLTFLMSSLIVIFLVIFLAIFVRILSALFDAITAYFFPGRFRRAEAERRLKELEKELDLLRRQLDAQVRADRVFADLEKGVRFDDPLARASMERLPTEEEAAYVTAKIFPDFVLPIRQVMDVFWLPVLRTDAAISGLVLREVEGTDKHYERLGMFETSPDEIKKLFNTQETQEFLLV